MTIATLVSVAAAAWASGPALGLAPDAHVAAFVGGDWGANHEALAFLRREVAPRLADEGGVLLAVGGASRRLVGLREPGLLAVGETDDLGAVLAAAEIGRAHV